jgi:hypothetical protein
MNKILILSYSNIFDKGYRNYENCLKKLGYNYKILGKSTDSWNGFMKTKIRRIYNYIKKLDDKETIVCITDVNDVLPIQGPEILYKEFKKFNKNIVIGSEISCISNRNCVSEQKKFNIGIKRKYVNGGFYIGYADSICQMMEYMFTLNEDDDQLCLGLYKIRHENCEIDKNANIIENVVNDVLTIKNNKIMVKDTETYPCFIHFPGTNGHRLNVYGKHILGDLFEPLTIIDYIKKLYLISKNYIKSKIYLVVLFYLFIFFLIFFVIYKLIKKIYKK